MHFSLLLQSSNTISLANFTCWLAGVLYLQKNVLLFQSSSSTKICLTVLLAAAEKSNHYFAKQSSFEYSFEQKKIGWAVVVVCPVQNKHLSRHCSPLLPPPSSSSLLLLLCNFFSAELFALSLCQKTYVHVQLKCIAKKKKKKLVRVINSRWTKYHKIWSNLFNLFSSQFVKRSI